MTAKHEPISDVKLRITVQIDDGPVHENGISLPINDLERCRRMTHLLLHGAKITIQKIIGKDVCSITDPQELERLHKLEESEGQNNDRQT